MWRCGGSNPGPFTCKANALPLSYIPSVMNYSKSTTKQTRLVFLSRQFVRINICLRPYHVENTSSRLITEVKQHWALWVLGWVTAWEHRVLKTLLLIFFLLIGLLSLVWRHHIGVWVGPMQQHVVSGSKLDQAFKACIHSPKVVFHFLIQESWMPLSVEL